jgi:hypothetical protein
MIRDKFSCHGATTTTQSNKVKKFLPGGLLRVHDRYFVSNKKIENDRTARTKVVVDVHGGGDTVSLHALWFEDRSTYIVYCYCKLLGWFSLFFAF